LCLIVCGYTETEGSRGTATVSVPLPPHATGAMRFPTLGKLRTVRFTEDSSAWGRVPLGAQPRVFPLTTSPGLCSWGRGFFLYLTYQQASQLPAPPSL
jgi:hypothetical protein